MHYLCQYGLLHYSSLHSARLHQSCTTFGVVFLCLVVLPHGGVQVGAVEVDVGGVGAQFGRSLKILQR